MKNLKPGTNFTAVSDFFTETGAPLVLTDPPEYAVRDNNQNLIVSGIAEQTNKPERWQALIALPATLIPGNYNIIWIAKTSKSKQINREQFSIVDSTPNYYELDLLVPEKSSVTDYLKTQSSETVSNISVDIITPEGLSIYQTTNVTESVQGENRLFRLKTPVLDNLYAGGSFALYIINWTFTVDGETQTEHHFVYVVNPKVLAYVNELRRMIDKAGIQNPNVALRYNNVDLVAYLNLGLQFVNLQPPQQTAFTLADIPNNLYIYVLYSAAVHALESRYMAEAEAAFNFNGQPITLEVDRTQFLDAAISRYNEKLGNLNEVKKGIAMSGGGSGGGVGFSSASGDNSGGVLSLSRGPLTQFSLLPWYNSRVVDYTSILYGLGYTV